MTKLIQKQISKIYKTVIRLKENGGKRRNFLMAFLSSSILSSGIKVLITGNFLEYFIRLKENTPMIQGYFFDIFWSIIVFIVVFIINKIFKKERHIIVSNPVRDNNKDINDIAKNLNINISKLDKLNEKILILSIAALFFIVSPMLTLMMQYTSSNWYLVTKFLVALLGICILMKCKIHLKISDYLIKDNSRQP